MFSPPAVDLVPGETVLLHVVNGGLEPHEAIIGDQAVQDAWEIAEANAPPLRPGATPSISVPPDVAGLRIWFAPASAWMSTWTVPADPADGWCADRRLSHPGPLREGNAGARARRDDRRTGAG